MIPSALTQFFENYFIHKMTPDEAVRSPRVHPGKGNTIQVEKSAPADVVKKLILAGYEVESVDTIWAVIQAIVRRAPSGPWEAVTETRYDGLALTQ